MEIAATGTSILASSAGTSAGEGGPAFAEALGDVGRVPAAAAEPASPAPVAATLGHAVSALNMPILANAPALQATTPAIDGTVVQDAPLTPEEALPIVPGAAEKLKIQDSRDLLPSGSDMPEGTATPAAPPSAIPASAAPPAPAKPASKESEPVQEQPTDMIASSPVPGQPQAASADTEEPAGTFDVATGEHQMPETLDDVQAEQADVPPASEDGISAPVALAAQPVHEQPKPTQAKPAELSLDLQPETKASDAATSLPKAANDGADTATEPFARMMTATAPERPQQQANVSAALPAGQPAGQAQSQPAQASVPLQVAAHVATESHPTVSFRSDKFAQDIGLEVARRVSLGGEELVIRLNPAELGRIHIRMSVNEQGHLRAVVAADAPGVLDTIRNDIPELSRALEQAGVRTDGQSFRFDRGGGNDSGGQWQQRYQQQQQHGGTRNGDDSGLASTEGQARYRPMATNGRINMMA